MVTDIVSVDYKQTISEACQVYKQKKVGCLVVTDGSACVGMLTERDIIERCICEGRNPEITLVADVMSADIITIHKLDTVEKAIELMRTFKIKKLPVLSNNQIVGIITMTDISYARPDLSDRFIDSWVKTRWVD